MKTRKFLSNYVSHVILALGVCLIPQKGFTQARGERLLDMDRPISHDALFGQTVKTANIADAEVGLIHMSQRDLQDLPQRGWTLWLKDGQVQRNIPGAQFVNPKNPNGRGLTYKEGKDVLCAVNFNPAYFGDLYKSSPERVLLERDLVSVVPNDARQDDIGGVIYALNHKVRVRLSAKGIDFDGKLYDESDGNGNGHRWGGTSTWKDERTTPHKLRGMRQHYYATYQVNIPLSNDLPGGGKNVRQNAGAYGLQENGYVIFQTPIIPTLHMYFEQDEGNIIKKIKCIKAFIPVTQNRVKSFLARQHEVKRKNATVQVWGTNNRIDRVWYDLKDPMKGFIRQLTSSKVYTEVGQEMYQNQLELMSGEIQEYGNQTLFYVPNEKGIDYIGLQLGEVLNALKGMIDFKAYYFTGT